MFNSKGLTMRILPVAILAASLGVSSAGCTAQGVGDPCVPETIPYIGSTQGFASSEIYLETSAVQCRTRVCMVYRLGAVIDNRSPANPEKVCTNANLTPDCVTPRGSCAASGCASNSLDRVFCSCRCRASAGGLANTPLCECGDGYNCVDIVDRGGAGLRGGYCVPRGMDTCSMDEDCRSSGGGTCVSGRCSRPR